MLLLPIGIIWGGYTLLWYGAGLIHNPLAAPSLWDLVNPGSSFSKGNRPNLPGGTAVNDSQVRESLGSAPSQPPAPATPLAQYGRNVNYRSALSSFGPANG